jgi:hypothetical protein
MTFSGPNARSPTRDVITGLVDKAAGRLLKPSAG